jgi:hypothetical protein
VGLRERADRLLPNIGNLGVPAGFPDDPTGLGFMA